MRGRGWRSGSGAEVVDDEDEVRVGGWSGAGALAGIVSSCLWLE